MANHFDTWFPKDQNAVRYAFMFMVARIQEKQPGPCRLDVGTYLKLYVLLVLSSYQLLFDLSLVGQR